MSLETLSLIQNAQKHFDQSWMYRQTTKFCTLITVGMTPVTAFLQPEKWEKAALTMGLPCGVLTATFGAFAFQHWRLGTKFMIQAESLEASKDAKEITFVEPK